MRRAFDLLRRWTKSRAGDSARAWFEAALARLLDPAARDRDLYIALGLAPRRLGKADLELSAEERAAAAGAREGWDPSGWTVDQAARLAFLLARFRDDEEEFRQLVERLFRTADVGELICFYRGLPLYPGQERFLPRAREGARTNMKPVFEAVAHRNPYPVERFSEDAWNQMVLKALFIDSRLWPIQGLDRRRNADLAQMLSDYAHERWAAGRPVSPELWRCVGPYATGSLLGDFERLVERGDEQERKAAALALLESPDADAVRLLDRLGAVADAARAGTISWDRLGRELS